MATIPLTHHAIIRITAPLTQSGLKVNLAASDRSSGYIEFVSQTEHEGSTIVIHALEASDSDGYILYRVAAHESGLISTLQCAHSDLSTALEIIEQVPVTRQMIIRPCFVIAHSFEVKAGRNIADAPPKMRSRFVCSQFDSLEFRLDTSMGAGMPADVRILSKGQSSAYLRDALADGGGIPLDHRSAQTTRRKALDSYGNLSTPAIPDDILAVLGTQWRPLRFQGDHWKGVLRKIEKPDTRTQRIEHFVEEALRHCHDTLQATPKAYHSTYSKQRWQVYFRRLQPVMVFIGILLLMPLSWLFVSSGAMTIHPLALGLTPLLMVGVVVLTAREIPVMEFPPRPSELPDSAWATTNTTQ